MLEEEADPEEFGALDGLTREDILRHGAATPATVLYTRLSDGTNVEVDSGFIVERLRTLMDRLDDGGFDLIVLFTTGVFEPFMLRTPLVHGDRAVDAWIAALTVGDCRIGVIYPLPGQDKSAHGTLIQSARNLAVTGDTTFLEDAAHRLDEADLILMHSVGYTDEDARRIKLTTGKVVVTARRIIGGAARLHLIESAGNASTPPSTSIDGGELINRLPAPAVALTQREREVLSRVLEGEANKVIGRNLGISHRTVEIHRSRAMSKLGAASVTDLIRRAMIFDRSVR